MDDNSPLDTDQLPDDLQTLIKPELEPGERLIWAGRSARQDRVRLRGYLIAAVAALGMLWGGAVAVAKGFSNTNGEVRNLQFEPFLWGMVFVIVGFLTATLALVDLIEKRKVVHHSRGRAYAVTDRRAIVCKPRQNTEAMEVFSVLPEQVRAIHRVEYPDRSGDVVFSFKSGEGFSGWHEPCFEGVANAQRVEALARRTLLPSDRLSSAATDQANRVHHS